MLFLNIFLSCTPKEGSATVINNYYYDDSGGSQESAGNQDFSEDTDNQDSSDSEKHENESDPPDSPVDTAEEACEEVPEAFILAVEYSCQDDLWQISWELSGIPEDVSLETQGETVEGYHSESYLSVKTYSLEGDCCEAIPIGFSLTCGSLYAVLTTYDVYGNEVDRVSFGAWGDGDFVQSMPLECTP